MLWINPLIYCGNDNYGDVDDDDDDVFTLGKDL